MRCPVCEGNYYEKEVILDDGTGPEYYCEYCDEGKIGLFRWIKYYVENWYAEKEWEPFTEWRKRK